MVKVGARIRLSSGKGPDRDGVVTAVTGSILRVRWPSGENTMVVPAPGTLTVLASSGDKASAAARKRVATKRPAKRPRPRRPRPRRPRPGRQRPSGAPPSTRPAPRRPPPRRPRRARSRSPRESSVRRASSGLAAARQFRSFVRRRLIGLSGGGCRRVLVRRCRLVAVGAHPRLGFRGAVRFGTGSTLSANSPTDLNGRGQLGSGTATTSNFPIDVAGLARRVAPIAPRRVAASTPQPI